MTIKGRHQSSCKDGKKSIKYIKSIQGVSAVIIGISVGGKSIGKNKTAGHVKIQREEEAGLKAILQTSKGIQEIFIKTDPQLKSEIKKIITSYFD